MAGSNIFLGPTVHDIVRYGGLSAVSGLVFEFGGVTSGKSGWIKYGGTSTFSFSTDAVETVPSPVFQWMFFYFRTPSALGSSGNYKGVFRLTYSDSVDFMIKNIDIQLYNDTGTWKLRIVQNGTQKAIGSTSISANTTYRICVKVDNSGGGSVEVFLNGTSEVSNSSWTNMLANTIGETIIRVGDSSVATYALWSQFIQRGDTTDTVTESHYPEVRQHLPTANSATEPDYDQYSSHVNNTDGSADYSYWNEIPQNGLTTFNQGRDVVGGQKQASRVQGRTYTNLPALAVLWLAYLRADFASKQVPHDALIRQSATDRTIALPVINSTSFAPFSAIFNTPPAGGTWDLDGSPALEVGHKRGETPGDNANVHVTALFLEGASLGINNEAPPDPPPLWAMPTFILPNPKREVVGY